MTCLCSGILFADIACWPLSHIPLEGELVPTEKIELSLGGHAANVSVGLSRLGVPTTTAGCVGDDGLSDFILNALSSHGVDTATIQRSPGRCPGTAMHINVREQDRRFICTTGANEDFVLTDELFEKIRSAPVSERKVFYLGGFFMLRRLENERTVEFLKAARENGWTTMVDVVLNGPRPYWDSNPFCRTPIFFFRTNTKAKKSATNAILTIKPRRFLTPVPGPSSLRREKAERYASARRNSFEREFFRSTTSAVPGPATHSVRA